MPCFPLISAIFFSFGCLRQFNLHWRRTRIPLSSTPIAEIQDFLNTPYHRCSDPPRTCSRACWFYNWCEHGTFSPSPLTSTPPTWCQLDTHTPYLSFMMLVSLELFWRQTFNHERHVKTILIVCCLDYGL